MSLLYHGAIIVQEGALEVWRIVNADLALLSRTCSGLYKKFSNLSDKSRFKKKKTTKAQKPKCLI